LASSTRASAVAANVTVAVAVVSTAAEPELSSATNASEQMATAMPVAAARHEGRELSGAAGLAQWSYATTTP
jgi:hypothetical protein